MRGGRPLGRCQHTPTARRPFTAGGLRHWAHKLEPATQRRRVTPPKPRGLGISISDCLHELPGAGDLRPAATCGPGRIRGRRADLRVDRVSDLMAEHLVEEAAYLPHRIVLA